MNHRLSYCYHLWGGRYEKERNDMGIHMRIHNVKNIDDFDISIPTEKGLYALTGKMGLERVP